METEVQEKTNLSKKTRDNLIGIMKDEVVELTFIKKDGTERVMYCTLKEDLLPVIEAKEETKERKVNEDVLAVYDVDAEGWRSFRWDSLTQIKLVLE
jgi:WYL_2, Sm-like SH3 beta-barrel fold